MKLIIDIPEEVYKFIQDNDYCGISNSDMYNAVKNGTPLRALKNEQSEQNVGRKFEEIVVEYPPAELCTYPEYKGKPYFSIKYEQNGEHIIGFGTYKPEFLSKYLREYFIAQTNIENVGMCQQTVGEMSEKQTDGMTLQEAIIHCEEVANTKCDECAEQHRQLAEWLKELKHLRNIVAYSTDFNCSVEKAEKMLKVAEEKIRRIEELND